MEAPLSRQTFFWIPNTVRVSWRTWTARYPAVAIPGYLWGYVKTKVNHVWNVMAHAQKPDLVFQRNGGVHLNWGGGSSRLLAAEVCASAVVMLDTPCSEVECKTIYWLPTPLACFPFTSPTVRHRVPSVFNWALPNGMMVTHKVPHVNSNGQHALSWVWNTSTSVINFCHLTLECYFI